MFKKRGQGLSITVIIAAVIGLIVLVVVVAILTGKLGTFSTTASSQGDCNAVCKAAGYNGGAASSSADITPGVKNAQGGTCKCT